MFWDCGQPHIPKKDFVSRKKFFVSQIKQALRSRHVASPRKNFVQQKSGTCSSTIGPIAAFPWDIPPMPIMVSAELSVVVRTPFSPRSIHQTETCRSSEGIFALRGPPDVRSPVVSFHWAPRIIWRRVWFERFGLVEVALRTNFRWPSSRRKPILMLFKKKPKFLEGAFVSAVLKKFARVNTPTTMPGGSAGG